MLKLAAFAFPHTMLWGGNVWGSRTEVQAKRPDPTKKAYALRGRVGAFSLHFGSTTPDIAAPKHRMGEGNSRQFQHGWRLCCLCKRSIQDQQDQLSISMIAVTPATESTKASLASW